MIPFSLDSLFTQFLRERQYVKNASPHTVEFYRFRYKTFARALAGESLLSDDGSKVLLTKRHLTNFVLWMREQGFTPANCNAHIRGINPFFTWLYENEFLSEHLKIKHLIQERRVMKSFSDAQLRAIVSYKPQSYEEHRLHALLCFLIDTGARIGEAFTVTRGKVDFGNMLVCLKGKGNKERLVPISIELRKVLWKFLQRHKSELVFPNRHGGQLLYDNMRRDFNALMNKLGIEGFDGSFHAFRRAFARAYVKNGGNLFYLQKALGHTTLTMSRRYVEVETEDLQETHMKVSPLSRLRAS
jgi:integrase/recombinase XerD